MDSTIPATPGRPCWVEIDASALEHNYRLLKAALQARETGSAGDAVQLLAVVKADAYGHGLEFCAPAAVRAGARWLGVTSVEEGIAARRLCPEPATEILVVSGVFPGQGAAAIAHRLTPVVWEPWQLDELETAAKVADCAAQSVAVHLEIDTGMSRQGVSSEDLHGLLARFPRDGALRLDGLMTHLYAADESDGKETTEQLARFKLAVGQVTSAGIQPGWLHVGNSAALLAGKEAGGVAGALSEMAASAGLETRAMLRPGLALYGSTPGFAPKQPASVTALRGELKPVMSWKTRVVSVRRVEPGQVVGYNGTFVATEPMRVALLAVGYADGLKRALSNRGWVLVRGRRCPIVGRISMDQTMVDVTEVPDLDPGTEVVLLGAQGEERITAEEHAEQAGTIVWEILTSIGTRVTRLPAGN